MSRILHISNTDIELDSRIRKELKALGALPGVQLTVLGVPENAEAGCTQLDGARYRKLRLASGALRLLPRAIRYVFQLIEFTFRAVSAGRRVEPDIVHCHDTFALPAGWILKRQLRCHLVYDAHELESDKNAQNAMLSWATLLIEKVCWKKIDLLISVSDSILDWYTRNLGAKPRVLVLNAPAIAAQGHTTGRGRYFHEKFHIPAERLVFVYLGIFSEGRGIEICLEAFAASPDDAHVVFIGYGRLEKTITEYASRHPNIHVHPAVPHDEVVPLVRSADFGLCLIERTSLSAYYCLPNKLFEYAFARIPVLASNFPEISRLVEQYSLGVCCDPNPGSVRVVLSQLTKCRPPRVASEIVSLGWEAQAARLTAAYRDQFNLVTHVGAPRAL